MEKYVVAISIDKVQTFLYERINSHTQEKQSEHGTLRNIIQSSNEISKELKKAINEKFCNKNIKVLLNCSGIQIFYIDIEENEIKENLNKLFVQYYKKFCGQALLKYVYFKKEDNNVIDQLKDISDAKKLLKHKDCMNKIIKENSEVLFKFEKKDYHENDIIIDKYKNFCNTIDELKDRNEKDEDEKEGNGKRFKVVMIKADLDGMGDLFKGLESYEVYDKISKILNEYISFEKLHDYVDILKKQYDDFKIFPLYMAGDDMFFAVLPRHLFAGIELTKFILNGINEELKKDIDLELKSDIINKELRMSIGVEFTYSHEPIRYYYDRVEEQLLIAKKEKCCKDDDFINNKLENYRKFKICINNLVFFDIDRKSLKDELDNTKYTDSNRINDQYKNLNNWRFFVHDMKLLYHIKQSGYSNKIGTRNNLYGLLSKITDSSINVSRMKYFNVIFYHLIPKFMNYNKNLRDLELCFNTMIISQLLKKSKNDFEFCFEKEFKQRLEVRIRLMLLFMDERFKINDFNNDKNEEGDNKENKEDILDGYKAKISSRLFNKPRRYLFYLIQLESGKNQSSVFLGKYFDENKKDNKTIYVPIYQKLNIEKSMFFTFKKLTENGRFDKIIDLLEMQNNNYMDEEKVINHNNERKSNGFTQNAFYFNKNKCLDFIKSSKWNFDYIDSLMLFYEYNKLYILYSKLEDKNKKNINNNKNKKILR